MDAAVPSVLEEATLGIAIETGIVNATETHVIPQAIFAAMTIDQSGRVAMTECRRPHRLPSIATDRMLLVENARHRL